jgi:UDP-N-acetylmuramoyl-tripeptide--D-alanyl-D-alanine ligase
MKNKLAPLVLSYLRFFAKLQLKKNPQAKIVGITGSAGKTSCQLAVLAALGKNKGRLKIKISSKANSESGIPLDILGLKVKDYSTLDWARLMLLAPWQVLTNWQQFDVYVVEMGIDSPYPPKNMEYLLSIVQPQIAIILNAQAVHSQNFDALLTETDEQKRNIAIIKEIAKEKSKLAQSLSNSGLAIINRDDSAIWQFSRETKAEILSFGQKAEADLRFSDWQVNLDGSRFVFEINNNLKKQVPGSRNLEINLSKLIVGQHHSAALASAILLALKLGLNLSEIKNNIEKYWQLEAGRSSLLLGKKNSYLLDSSYNASGMLEMIRLSSQLAANDKRVKRLVAILGDMREMGKEAKLAHQALTQLLVKDFTELYLVGPLMEKYALAILKEKINKKEGKLRKVSTFSDSKLAGEALLKNLKAGDLALVKGSQNTIFLEKAVEVLLADNLVAKKVLCRQNPYWLKVKNEA